MSLSQAGRQADGQETDLDLGEVLELLRARRRREVLDHLDREGATPFGDLVDATAREIHGLGYTTDERKRLYVALYQNHLPRLREYGVVAFETGEGEDATAGATAPTGENSRIRPGPSFERVVHILDSLREAAEEEAVEGDRPRPVTQTLADLLRGDGSADATDS